MSSEQYMARPRRWFQFSIRSMLAFVTVLLVGVWGWWSTRPEVMYDRAMREFRSGDHGDAATHFDRFIYWHPQHERMVAAQGWRTLARMRFLLKSDSLIGALECAEQLKDWEDTPEFREEFKSTSVQIAERFIAAAKAATDTDEKERLIEYAGRTIKHQLMKPIYIPQ